MKKMSILLIMVLMIVFGFAAFAVAASWTVQVSWTKSTGPNLASEQVVYSPTIGGTGTNQCSPIVPPAATTCTFTTTTNGGEVWVHSVGSTGAVADTSRVPVQGLSPATGIAIVVTYNP